MKRKGSLQFESQNIPGNHRIQGWAVDPDRGDVVAHMIFTKGHTRMMDPEVSGVESFEMPGGQMAFPITHDPPRVAWASATRAGRVAAAPHLLAAAMVHEHGITPVADATLSPQGAAMSRSAARRGLIKPHPRNPTMEATASDMEYGTPEQIDRHLSESHLGSYQGAHGHASYDRPVPFSKAQMGLAHQRVFGSRKKKVAEPEPVQGTLF